MNESKPSFWRREGVQSVIASLLCILLGLIIGYIVMLFISPAHAWEGLVTILENFFTFGSPAAQLKYFGSTLVKTAPLLLCALSIQFCYKVGLFNIGAAGQYVAGAGLCLYAALAWQMPWYLCLLLALVGGAVMGLLVGILKAYCNVNEVISGIMLNWIGLYSVNMLLTEVKEVASPYTLVISSVNPSALLPTMGLDTLFSKNQYVTIAIPLSILITLLIWFIQRKTVLGYELQATGYNKDAAKYCGMKEKRNIILTLSIGGALAGVGAAFLYLTGFEQWSCTQSSVPAMGFNGIAATFLGGLDPIGTIFASYFIQHITSGGAFLDKAFFPSQITDLITSIIIYLCGFVLFFKLHLAKRRETKRKPPEKAEDSGTTPETAAKGSEA
jgi:ABC-type uncharacterized transport system permease subunit